MDDVNVRISRLEPMRVASVLGFGTEPEIEAWGKLIVWAKPLGLLDQPDQYFIFGFNHPEPTETIPAAWQKVSSPWTCICRLRNNPKGMLLLKIGLLW